MGYRGKVEEQERARELRAEGWTMPDIAEELGVSRSSVSLWTRDIELPPRPRRRSPAARNGPEALRRRKEAEVARLRAAGAARIGRLTEHEFLVAGVALYAAEGAKTDGTVSMANTDPLIIEFFCVWLRRFFDVEEDRLRASLYLHRGLDLDAATAHWTRVTGIPKEQFTKPYRAVPEGGIRHTKHVHGCLTVRYSSSAVHREIMGMITALFGRTARADIDPEALPLPSAWS